MPVLPASASSPQHQPQPRTTVDPASISHVVNVLTEACHKLQNVPTTKDAEATFQEFARNPDALQLSKLVLESTSFPSLQFYVANILKDAALREYSVHPKDYMLSIRDFLVNYCLSISQRDPSNTFAINKIVHAAVVITKRAWLDLTGDERSSFLAQTIQLRSGNAYQRFIGLRLISQLLEEFSNDSTAVGLSWDFHHRCRKTFEETELRQLFEVDLAWLHEFVVDPALLHVDGELQNAKMCATILLHILSWEFTSFRTTFAGSFSSKLNQSGSGNGGGGGGESSEQLPEGMGKFPATWDKFIVRPEVIDLLFRLHQILVEDDDSGITMRCLQQLACIKGPVFHNDGAERAFASHLLGRMTEMIASFNTTATFDADTDDGDELTGIATVVKRAVSNFLLSTLGPLPSFIPFLTEVCKLTINCLKNSKVSDDVVDSDISDDGAIMEDSWTADAADILMDAWSVVAFPVLEAEMKAQELQYAGATAAATNTTFDLAQFFSFLESVGPAIFQTYVDSKLISIEHTASLLDRSEQDEVASLVDDDPSGGGMDDRVVYEDQLLYLSVMGRLNPHPACALLTAKLGERFQKLKVVIQIGGSAEQRQMLFEQIHWLVLMAGFLLADEGVGEKPVVHRSFVKMSMAAAQANGGAEDYTVALPTLVFNVLAYMTAEDESPLLEVLSPLLLKTLLWFSERWSRTYLFAYDTDPSTELSPTLIKSFSKSGGDKVLHFLVESCARNFSLWSFDHSVLSAVIDLLSGLASVPSVRSRLLRSDRFREIVHYFLRTLQCLPSNVHSTMVELVASISTQGVEPGVEEVVFKGLLASLGAQLHSVIDRQDFATKYQESEIKLQIINTLEMFHGLAAAADYRNATLIFSSVAPYLSIFSRLFGFYSSHFDVNFYILAVYLAVAKILEFDGLDPQSRQILSESLISVLKMYTDANQGMKTRPGQIDDDLFKDLSLILEILGCLVEHGSKEKDLVDVIFYGVNTVLPMFPRVCSDYLKLTGQLLDRFPEKLPTLPPPLVAALVDSIRFGIQQPIQDVQRVCFDSVAAVVRFCIRAQAAANSSANGGAGTDGAQQPQLETLLAHLDGVLRLLLDLLLFEELDAGFVDAAGEAVFSLIVLRHPTFVALVRHLIAAQPDPLRTQRLHAAFDALDAVASHAAARVTAAAGAAVLDNASLRAFQEGLVAFLMDVRGFLRVK
ncbi:armadillo-type protein [Zopfochytrium polystomum]|nr:armadillo-type protein [Zopfochytrium polystomum]